MDQSKLQEVTWTTNMKNDLLFLYDETMEERYDPDGCTVNVKSSLHLKWEENGYGHYGLTPQDLLDQSFKIKYHNLVTNFDKEYPIKLDKLRKVFDELAKVNEVPVADVAESLRELDVVTRPGPKETDKETEKNQAKKIERDIRHALKLEPDVKNLTMIQTLDLLNSQLPVDQEQSLVAAFQVFDINNTGSITMSELENIMSMHGRPLNEQDLETLKTSCKIFNGQENQDQETEDPEIDYRAFIKHFLKKIKMQEKEILGYK